MKKGAFTLVLHSHLPYCRRAGRWPHGEEWLHEAMSETYVPLLNNLYDLVEEGVAFKMTIGLTPVLTEQLADSLVLEHFEMYLADKIDAAQGDVARFQQADEGHLLYLAQFYLDWYQKVRRAFKERFGGDIVGAFRGLQDRGYIEIVTSAATHGYLPLLERDSFIYAQLAVGVESYKRHFGRAPRAIWLPECAYRSAFYATVDGEKYYKPGFEEFLSQLGLSLFFAETHTIEGGLPVGKATGKVIGPYGGIPKRYVVPLPDYVEPTERTTYLPYFVAGADVAVIGRNDRTGMQVWSADWGYPGDYNYREFHRKDGLSGLQYWKVTGARVDLGQKDYYDPYWAQQKMREHAAHFSHLVEDLIVDFYGRSGRYGIIASNYDAELFGHWWFEGVDWIREMLRHLSHSQTVELTTASDYIEEHPPEDVLALPESSWGLGGGHFTWMNADTEWMWPLIHEAELRMERLVDKHPRARRNMRQVLNQAARELLLLQSSDWPFLVTTGQAREYSIGRFSEHISRFNRLAEIAESGRVDGRARELCQEYLELDNLFPDIDYRLFKNREKYEKLRHNT